MNKMNAFTSSRRESAPKILYIMKHSNQVPRKAKSRATWCCHTLNPRHRVNEFTQILILRLYHCIRLKARFLAYCLDVCICIVFLTWCPPRYYLSNGVALVSVDIVPQYHECGTISPIYRNKLVEGSVSVRSLQPLPFVSNPYVKRIMVSYTSWSAHYRRFRLT